MQGEIGVGCRPTPRVFAVTLRWGLVKGGDGWRMCSYR